MRNTAASGKRAEGNGPGHGGLLSKASHAVDTARQRSEFQTRASFARVCGSAPRTNRGRSRRGYELTELSRRVRRLRRKVYRQMPVATRNHVAQLDHRTAYAGMKAALEEGCLGVLSAGAALALWRACHEFGLRAWCYEFGFPRSLTHTLTVVEVDDVLQVHDAFFNLSYPCSFDHLLSSLRDGSAVTGTRETRDRKIYIVDPVCEAEQTVRWLEAHADRELEPVDGTRRFELLWNPETFAATHPGIPAASRDLAALGYPGDLQFLMLHPVAVFDGEHEHHDRTTMPLVGERDLRSPVAELRVAGRNLKAERTTAAQRSVTIAHLEAELTDANVRITRLIADRDDTDRAFTAEREAWLQQKVALQARKSALEGEIAETRQRLSAANDLRAQRDSQVAQLRAEVDDTRQQVHSERLQAAEARLRLETENRDLRTQLEAVLHDTEELRCSVASLEGEARAAQQHAIEISHYMAPLIEELDRSHQSLAGAREERAVLETRLSELTIRIAEAEQAAVTLEAKIAASFGARLAALWRRLTITRLRWFRSGEIPTYQKATPPGGFEH
jgi:hypothetical protein